MAGAGRPTAVRQSSGPRRLRQLFTSRPAPNARRSEASRLAGRLLKHQLVKNPRELLSAAVAGSSGTGVDLGVLVVLVGQRVPIPLATFIAALAGAATNFTLNKYVAFRDRSPISLGQVARFYVVAVIAALLMAAAMEIATANLAVPV